LSQFESIIPQFAAIFNLDPSLPHSTLSIDLFSKLAENQKPVIFSRKAAEFAVRQAHGHEQRRMAKGKMIFGSHFVVFIHPFCAYYLYQD